MKSKRLLGFRTRARVGVNVVMVLIVLLLIMPLWYVLNNAFKVEQEILRRPLVLLPSAATFDSVIRAFTAMKYPRCFINSAIILVLSCAVLLSLGSLAAFGIAMANSRFMNTVYIVLVAMITLPFQLAMVPLIFLLKSFGLINSYLGTALVYSGWFMPFVIFLYTGFIRTIPKELEEAGRVDGCGLLRSFVSIYAPLLKSITGTVLILRGVPIWNDLLVPIITISRATMSTLPLKLYSFIGTPGSSAIRWNLVFGSTFIVSLPILLVFLFLQRYIVSGVVAGAIKG
ncbi:MAG: carbohydrate ABC transporter permease [Spirochaetaceae bacterium]|nr:MAG: carbohydrate ABC transporter permease [Spirochaetaceae bacterium]